jgi:hypothetical protein
MGAEAFTTYAEGATYQDAYDTACDGATAEYGHDGYNGTISTTSGVALVHQTPLPRSAAERLAYTDAILDKLNKWEHAGAIPVAEDRHFRWRNQTITVTSAEDRWDAAEQASAKLNLRPNEVIYDTKAETLSENTKVTSRTTEGKAVTRYYIATNGAPGRTGYDTQAQARKAAEAAIAKRGVHPRASEISILGVKRREDGSPLVEVKAETKRKVKIRFRLATPKAANTPIKGWVFTGWAAT